MKYFIRSIFVVLALMPFNIQAMHIIGGDVTYECRGIDTVTNRVRFLITFTLYRDSKGGGAEFDQDANFGVYRGGGSTWTWVNTISNLGTRIVQDVPPPSDNPCILIPVNVGVQRGVYSFEVSLPIIAESYMIVYQRCCRNNSILNLSNPGQTGAAFSTEITSFAQRNCNNSPKFNNFPPIVICVNRPINFDHSAADIDGDSLVYEFCSPLTAGGTDGATTSGSATSCTGVTPNPRNCRPPYAFVDFLSPNYSPSNPMGGNPIVSINSSNGFIDGIPNLLGQFIVGVCVKEYRNGELIGTLFRDFQFNVTTCEIAVMADIESDAVVNESYIINSCGPTTINFKNESTDSRYIKNYYWEVSVGGQKDMFSSRDLTYTFPGLGTYTATMILNKDIPGAEECSDTADIIINLYPSIEADFIYKYDTCVAGPISFTDMSVSGAGPIIKWNWDFGEGSSNQKNPIFEYEKPGDKLPVLIAEDSNACRDTISKNISYFPIPALIVIDPNTFVGCNPADIFFKNLSAPIDSTYTFNWNFGDGNTSNLISPSNTYTADGIYTVSLELISPIGCKTDKTWNNLIKIVPSPVAAFSYTPEKPNSFDNTIHFIDESVDGFAFQWLFDDLGVSTLRSPSYTFKDTGTYEIKQIVLHKSGCSDTAIAYIPIVPFINFYMPNAFTPNGDGLNDEFLPVGIFDGGETYEMNIWNRWGDRIFVSNSFDIGWNGMRNNDGEPAPNGVYAYTIEYIDAYGKPQMVKGHCTLIRPTN